MVLRVNAMFWRQMGEHCKELANSDLKEKVTMFKTAPPSSGSGSSLTKTSRCRWSPLSRAGKQSNSSQTTTA